MNKTLNDIGKDGFYWFIGVVENRIAPEGKLNQVQVRIFGSHSEKRSDLSTEDLPWARVFGSVNSRSETHDLQEGDLVFGFYLDGEQSQEPAILSTIVSNDGGKSSTVNGFTDPREAFDNFPKVQDAISDDFSITYKNRSNNSTTEVRSQLSQSRSKETYGKSFVKSVKDKVFNFFKLTSQKQFRQTHAESVYPFNKSRETESGHVIEYDDTPGSERIMIMHRSGSYYEFDKNGDLTTISRNNNTITILDKLDAILKNYDISVKEKMTITAESLDIELNKYLNITAPSNKITGNLRITDNLYVESAASGTFLTQCGKIITVVNGIVVNIK